MKTKRKIDTHDFSGCGDTFFLYQFASRNGRATELVCPLADEYINGQRNFQFVFQRDALKYRDSAPALRSSFVNRIPANEVDFILEIDPN